MKIRTGVEDGKLSSVSKQWIHLSNALLSSKK
jgi:hypothetical protein